MLAQCLKASTPCETRRALPLPRRSFGADGVAGLEEGPCTPCTGLARRFTTLHRTHAAHTQLQCDK